MDATSAGASAANPYPSEINVEGLSGTISDVNVKLNGYSTPFADDVAAQIVGPDGTSVLLMSDVGGDVDVNSINLTLDEGQLTTGTYKPTKGTTPFCPPLTPSCLGNDPESDRSRHPLATCILFTSGPEALDRQEGVSEQPERDVAVRNVLGLFCTLEMRLSVAGAFA